jgi:hypothetical protein
VNAFEELRAAAKTLREVAGKATRGPWVFFPTITREDDNEDAWTVCRPICESGTGCEADCGANVLVTGAEDCVDDYVKGDDVEWIALMHPGLAEPLAVWLDAVAGGWEKSAAISPGGSDARFAGHPALAVARVINGGDES